MRFKDKLKAISIKNNSLVCVGLDSDISKIPEFIRKGEHPQSTFNKAIIEATHDLVCAYKPNTAFYEERGHAGIEEIKMTSDYLKEKYPEVPLIIDAKGIFILCRTSNPGAGEFQDLEFNGKKLFQIVAENVVKDWNTNNNCALVVGATYPSELEIVRHIVGDNFPLLIPGIGVQGGQVEKTVKAGVDGNGLNAVINSSRGIIFASNRSDFADKARQKAIKLRDDINKYRKESI